MNGDADEREVIRLVRVRGPAIRTAKGRRLLGRARRLMSETEDEILAGLTAKERGELVSLLRRALDAAPTQPLWSAAEGD